MVSTHDYCSDFNGAFIVFLSFNRAKVSAERNRIFRKIAKSGCSEHDYLQLKVLPTVKV